MRRCHIRWRSGLQVSRGESTLFGSYIELKLMLHSCIAELQPLKAACAASCAALVLNTAHNFMTSVYGCLNYLVVFRTECARPPRIT